MSVRELEALIRNLQEGTGQKATDKKQTQKPVAPIDQAIRRSVATVIRYACEN